MEHAEEGSEALKESMRAHLDDIKIAKKIAKGAGYTPLELAIRRAVEGDVSTTKSALGASENVSDGIKFTIMAVAFENAAEKAEKRVSQGESPETGINLRNQAKDFRQAGG